MFELLYVDGDPKTCDGCHQMRICAAIDVVGGNVACVCKRCLRSVVEEFPDGPDKLTTLYRPVGQEELDLIMEVSEWNRFPPRLPEQPIFYPVMNLEYARQITREWNVSNKGVGHVVRFHVDSEFIARYPVHNVGGEIHNELWIPAEELEEFNDHIVGSIMLWETHTK